MIWVLCLGNFEIDWRLSFLTFFFPGLSPYMNDKIKMALCGAGLVGKRHVTAIEQLNNVECDAIIDPSDAGKIYAKEQGIEWFSSLNEMFANRNPDGIILATPTPIHVEQGLECLAHNKPILVEKPLASSSSDALELVNLALSKNIALLVGHHRRYNPLIANAKAIIDSGELGAIRAVHSNCWFYKPDHYFEEAPWRKQKGAGPISVNLVHDVDLIRHLCGEVVSVQAQASPSARGFENEDVAAAVLQLENGAIVTITVSDSVVAPWSWEMTSNEYPIYPTTRESCYQIGGTRASLSVPDMRLWKHEDKPDWWTPISGIHQPQEGSDPLVNQILHFARVIKGEDVPLVSGIEGLRSLQVVEAIQMAANSGEKVFITEPNFVKA